MTSPEHKYSPAWVGEQGLDLDPGFCITFVRGVTPGEALLRVSVPEADLRIAKWHEFVAEAAAMEPAFDHYPMAAWAVDGLAVVVEENGFIGRTEEWNIPLSRATELVFVYQSPTSLSQELGILRDGEEIVFMESDAVEECEVDDPALGTRLLNLAADALQPWDEGDPTPISFDEGRVDLLQVACDYLGLRPSVAHFKLSALGAPVRIRG